MNLDAPRRYALRALVVVLCLAALADLRPTPGRGEVLPIAVVDVSRSVGRMPQALPEDVRVQRTWVVFADGVEEVIGGAEAPTVGRGASRLAAALRHAASAHPGADVVLITDGHGTDGDAKAAARALHAAGGRVYTLAPETPRADVGLEEARLVAGWPAPRVRAVLAASTSGHVRVRLVQGTRVVNERRVAVAPGARHDVELADPSPPARGGTYHVVLVPERGTPDDDPADDRLSVGLRPARRVVLFWGIPEAAGFDAGPELVVRSRREAEPEELEGADVVVLGNLPWRDLGNETARALERFVAGGGRLLLLGGPEAYAGGGWAGTRLETALAPLRVPRQEGNQLAMVLALDVSGSTQGARLAHLKEAVRRTVQGLVPGERLGILPFRGEPDAGLLAPGVVGYGDASRREALLAAVDALEARGDTDLPAALRRAAERVAALEARTRRVILLTDGDPDNPPSPEALTQVGTFLRERGIGFGAFVVGDDEAVQRLGRYVAAGPEDVVAVDRVETLPLRLLHALGARRHDKALVHVRRPAELRWAEPGDPALAPLPGLVPGALHALEVAGDAGAVGLARVQHEGADGYDLPFAGVRTVGAGRVVGLAWGPALEARHAARPAAVAALRPWIQALASASDRGLRADLDGEALVVRWPAAAGAGRILAAAGGPATDLVEAAPGLFRGPLPAGADAGVLVRREAEGGAVRPLHLPARPPAEHRGAGVDRAALQALAAAGGGRRLEPGEPGPAGTAPAGAPLAPWFLLLAGMLLVLDRLGAKPDAGSSDSPGGAGVGP